MASKAKFQAATTAFTSGVRNVLDYTRIALRFLQLQILSWKASLSKSTEEPKVAIYKDRKAALLHACLHLVPMSAALALMILNIRSYFVGGISPTKVTALQFSAKLLEILMQASLAAILFGLVRHELVGGRNLPLGSILAPLHITDISYLWSLNHWGSLTSQDPRGWRKLSLLVIIPATIILAALVGPSSAVLMIPRPISYLYGKELDFTDEAATSFTTDEGLPGGHLLDKPSLYPVLEQVRAIEPDNGTIYNIAESDGSRNAIIQVHYGPGDVTVLDATVPAQSVWNLIQPYSSDGRLTARARQPYVRTRCGEVQYMNSDNATDTYFYFGPSEQELNKLIQVDEYLRFNNDSAPTLRQGELPLNSTIFWLRAPSSSSRHSVLMAYGNHWNDSNVDYWFFTGCTVDAVWANSDLNSTVAEGVSCVNVDEMYNDVTIWQESANWIDMDPSWAREVELLYRTTAGGRYEPSAVAALILALAVSGADPELDNATFTRYDRVRPAVQDPLLDYLKKNKLLQRYPDGNIWVYASDGWTNPATLMRVDFRFYHDGYGYDSSTVTVQLSLAVITIYLSAALAYVISTLWTGEVGSSWDSAGGVLLLGMNSKRPAHLGDTSAGIETLKTYKEPVNIRVNDENHLELVFANNASTRSTAYRRVVANHRY